MATQSPLYIGTGRFVAAIHPQTGEERWRTKLPHGGGSIVTTLIAKDTLFAGHWGHVYCLDRRDGELIWANDLPRMGHHPVMLAADFAMARQPKLYIGTSRFVAALDPQTGEEIWRVKLPHSGSPIVSLILEKNSLFAGHGGYLYRLDKRTGSIVWENGLRRMGYHPVLPAMEGAASSSAAAAAAGHRAEQQRRAAATAAAAS